MEIELTSCDVAVQLVGHNTTNIGPPPKKKLLR